MHICKKMYIVGMKAAIYFLALGSFGIIGWTIVALIITHRLFVQMMPNKASVALHSFGERRRWGVGIGSRIKQKKCIL